jgi:hypothetical protein
MAQPRREPASQISSERNLAMKFPLTGTSPSRIHARRALIWSDAQISATFLAMAAMAARWNEPLATLGRLVPSGGCIPSTPLRLEPSVSAHLVSTNVSPAGMRRNCAHWPEPLTAPGAAEACPTCLVSQKRGRLREVGSKEAPGRSKGKGSVATLPLRPRRRLSVPGTRV